MQHLQRQLRKEYKERYDEEIQKMQARLLESLTLFQKNAAEANDNISDVNDSFLKDELAKLRSIIMSDLEIDTPQNYDPARALLLQHSLENSKFITTRIEEKLANLKSNIVCTRLDGTRCSLEVSPAIETVHCAKQRLQQKHGINDRVKLVSVAAIELSDMDLLMNYNLIDGLTLVKVGDIAENLLLWLPFDDPENLAHDRVSDQTGTFMCRRHVLPVDQDGRRGVNFSDDRARLLLPQKIELGDTYTVSFWMLTPEVHLTDSYRLAIASAANDDTCTLALIDPDNDFGVTTPYGYCSIEPCKNTIPFDLDGLADGWHHVVAIGSDDRTRFFVDGELVGVAGQQCQGIIGVVGNSGDDPEVMPWGAISDLRIYGAVPHAKEYEAGQGSSQLS